MNISPCPFSQDQAMRPSHGYCCNCLMTSSLNSVNTTFLENITLYLAGGVSAHSVGRGLYRPVGPVDHHAAPGVVLDPVASPGVRLVRPRVHVKSEIKQ